MVLAGYPGKTEESVCLGWRGVEGLMMRGERVQKDFFRL